MTLDEEMPRLEQEAVGFSGEWANVATHGLGLALSLPAAAILLLAAARSGNPWLLAGCLIYAFTLIGVYAASTLSHLYDHSPQRRFFRALDQALIYTFIVGTYTPFSLVYLRGSAWWLLLGLMWAIAAGGAVEGPAAGAATRGATAASSSSRVARRAWR